MSTLDSTQHYILIVEDDPLVQKMLQVILSHAGYQIDSAPEGGAALEKISQRKPDLITLDMMMPGMSGIEFLKQVAQMPALATIPILIVSAITNLEETFHGIQISEHMRILEKPFQRQVLLCHIAAMLKSSLSHPLP